MLNIIINIQISDVYVIRLRDLEVSSCGGPRLKLQVRQRLAGRSLTAFASASSYVAAHPPHGAAPLPPASAWLPQLPKDSFQTDSNQLFLHFTSKHFKTLHYSL